MRPSAPDDGDVVNVPGMEGVEGGSHGRRAYGPPWSAYSRGQPPEHAESRWKRPRR